MNLQNNSNEMKTVVETFVIEETAELIYDNEKLDKWNELVAELKLDGQTKIVELKRSPIPFMHLKKSMVAVFECLCPRKELIQDYNITPIPVEILELAALSLREDYFTKIEIWYDDKSPDPVCVGIMGQYGIDDTAGNRIKETPYFKRKKEAEKYITDNGLSKCKIYDYSWGNKEHYLLGKWADVKHSFEELKEMATKRFMAERGNELRKQIKEAERGLVDLETEAFDKFN